MVLPDLSWGGLWFQLVALTTSPYIHIFFWLMWLDIITGYLKAFKTKKFDSKTGTLGLLRHGLVLSTIIIVAVYSRALGIRIFGISWCMFFVFNYLGSVIENWEAIGWWFPEALKPYVNQKKKENSQLLQNLLDDKISLPREDKEDKA